MIEANRLTRRLVIVSAASGIGGFALNTVFANSDQKIITQSQNEPQEVPSLSEGEEPITLFNLNSYAERVKKKSQKFSLVQITRLEEVNPSTGLTTSPALSSEDTQLLEPYGIRSYLLGHEAGTNRITLYLKAKESVKQGSLSSKILNPMASCIFATDDRFISIPSVPSVHIINPAINPEYIDGVFVLFLTRESDLIGVEFMAHVNAGLFYYDGKNNPSFTLPHRFVIEKPFNPPRTRITEA